MDEKVIANMSDLTAIANAVRNSTGSTETYSVPELSVAAVDAINNGGSASKYKQPEWGHEVSNGTIEVLPERTYNWPNEKQHFSKVEEDNFSLVSGKVYTVNYNGVSYSCTACHDETGAGVLIGGEGYPFEIIRYIDILAEMQNAYGQISVFDDSNPFTVSVTLSEEVKVYHKIPGEYVGGVGKYKQPEWGVESTEILKRTALEQDQSENGAFAIWEPLSNDLVVGEKYTVMWNDTEYTCTAKIGTLPWGENVYVGNDLGIDSSLGDSGEPFTLIVSTEEMVASGGWPYVMILPREELKPTTTLSITRDIYHTIPGKYVNAVMRVNVNKETKLSDKTFAEIYEAINAGASVYVVADFNPHTYVYHLDYVSDSQIIFKNMSFQTDVSFTSDGEISIQGLPN